MEKFTGKGTGTKIEKEGGLSRRKFLRRALEPVAVGAAAGILPNLLYRSLVEEDFSADKKVQKSVADFNLERPLFDQIAKEWKNVAEITVADYPEDQPDSVVLRGAKARYKNFSEIRGVLNNIHEFIVQFEKCEQEFAEAIKERNKDKTLSLGMEMKELLDALQEFVIEASKIPSMNDFIAEYLEGQRSA